VNEEVNTPFVTQEQPAPVMAREAGSNYYGYPRGPFPWRLVAAGVVGYFLGSLLWHTVGKKIVGLR
jgi:hypothetical protein